MTDRRAPEDPKQPPEDVASLFSWANLRGGKYKDFSASRAQNRERARLQMQQDAEREQAMREAQIQQEEAARLAAEAALAQERARLAERAALEAAQRASQLTGQLPAQAARPEEEPPQTRERTAPSASPLSSMGSASVLQQSRATTGGEQVSPETAFVPQAAGAQGLSAARSQSGTPSPAAPSYPAEGTDAELRGPLPSRPGREERTGGSVRTPWSGPGGRDLPTRPAWLAERPGASAAASAGQNPDDTLQGSRERLTSRWFALKTIVEGGVSTSPESAPAPTPARPPVLAVFSLAGGVGKTSVVATLGRVLSSRGERVLLVDTAAFGLLPFFFGARDQRPGQLRTFTPPVSSGDAPIQMISLEPGMLAPDDDGQDPLSAEILEHGRVVSRVIVDLATASGATARRILPLAPLVLVPVVPDMNSVVGVGSIDNFFERNSGAAGKSLLPYYVLNQFDASLPLHLDVREVLREQLGDRLLPFALRRTPAVSEALAEGMTVMDYAPNSTVADDFNSLAGWVKTQSAPAMTGFRGVRWSER